MTLQNFKPELAEITFLEQTVILREGHEVFHDSVQALNTPKMSELKHKFERML